MRRLVSVVACVLTLLILNGVALAHDDPIVTVRVMCDGFNVLNIDAVLGEISETATLSVDRPVHGASEIAQWVKDQMDHDLRIEIVDIGSPERLSDGYTLSWTARFSRADWRRDGVTARGVTNAVIIHNGRITDWNASFSADAVPPATHAAPSQAPAPPISSGPSELLGIPITLVLAVLVLAVGGVWLARHGVRKA